MQAYAQDTGQQYEVAKQDIIFLLPTDIVVPVKEKFHAFENVSEDTAESIIEQRKNILNEILAILEEKVASSTINVGVDQIDPIDMEEIIFSAMCDIATIYAIPSKNCIKKEITEITTTSRIRSTEDDTTMPDHFEITIDDKTFDAKLHEVSVPV